MENYRPLKILHGYSFGEAGTDIGEKKRIIENGSTICGKRATAES